MRTKVFFLFLCTIMVMMACSGNDDMGYDEPEKSVSEHYSTLRDAEFIGATLTGLVDKYTKNLKGRILTIGNRELVVSVTIDPDEFTSIPGSGRIMDAHVMYYRSYQVIRGKEKYQETEKWEMQSVDNGRYAFRGGTASVGVVDDEHVSVRLSFGPIVDDHGVIDLVEIDCVCERSNDLWRW